MFTEKEKQIFGPYWNGEDMVFADPIKAYRRLVASCHGDISAFIKEGETNTLKRSEFSSKVQEVFGLLPFNTKDGSGCTEEHADIVWDLFVEWTEKNWQAGKN